MHQAAGLFPANMLREEKEQTSKRHQRKLFKTAKILEKCNYIAMTVKRKIAGAAKRNETYKTSLSRSLMSLWVSGKQHRKTKSEAH